jgi:soluble lytic murein transglycosylase-like protein
MKTTRPIAWLAAVLALAWTQAALARDAQYDALVAAHAKANNVPEALVHRVILRESGYRPGLVSRGNIGLMQIKLGTARGLGYSGTAEGLRDPGTNLSWAVKYLAGAYRAANGDHRRAMAYYASGYYHAAKRQRLERVGYSQPVLTGVPTGTVVRNAADANALQVPPR